MLSKFPVAIIGLLALMPGVWGSAIPSDIYDIDEEMVDTYYLERRGGGSPALYEIEKRSGNMTLSKRALPAECDPGRPDDENNSVHYDFSKVCQDQMKGQTCCFSVFGGGICQAAYGPTAHANFKQVVINQAKKSGAFATSQVGPWIGGYQAFLSDSLRKAGVVELFQVRVDKFFASTANQKFIGNFGDAYLMHGGPNSASNMIISYDC